MLASRSAANLVLRILTVLLLLGWAWQLWRWTIPLASFFQTAWPSLEPVSVHTLQQFWGLSLGICGLIALGADRIGAEIIKYSMAYASLSLFLIFLLIFHAKNYQWGNLIEHSIQWSLPLVFAYYRYGPHLPKAQWALRLLIAATFFGHGLYAIGYYAVPASYLEMVYEIFGFGPASAERFLFVAGVLDMITVVGLLIPQLWRYVLYYAIVWGFLTAMARLVAHWDTSLWLDSLDMWLNQSLIRLGHGGVPLVLWLLEKASKDQISKRRNTAN